MHVVKFFTLKLAKLVSVIFSLPLCLQKSNAIFEEENWYGPVCTLNCSWIPSLNEAKKKKERKKSDCCIHHAGSGDWIQGFTITYAAMLDKYIVSIQVAPAILWITKTWNLLTFVLMVKMVVICYLFSRENVPLSKKYNLPIWKASKALLTTECEFWMLQSYLHEQCLKKRERKVTFFSFLTDITLATQFGWWGTSMTKESETYSRNKLRIEKEAGIQKKPPTGSL